MHFTILSCWQFSPLLKMIVDQRTSRRKQYPNYRTGIVEAFHTRWQWITTQNLFFLHNAIEGCEQTHEPWNNQMHEMVANRLVHCNIILRSLFRVQKSLPSVKCRGRMFFRTNQT